MTGKEFNEMTKVAQRLSGGKMTCRTDVEEYAFVLFRMTQAIGREELSQEIFKFYSEMEEMSDEEVCNIEQKLFK